MTVHRNRVLVNKTNRCTEFQCYLYYDSTCFGQPFCPSSGVLSRTSAVVHFMQLWWPFATRSSMEHPILLVLRLYIFRAAFLPIIRSFKPYIGCGTFYAVVMTVCYREQDGTAFHPAPCSKRPSQLHKMYHSRCTSKNSWWWAERLPEICRVIIPIKLEFSASVGLIHKENNDRIHWVYPNFHKVSLFPLSDKNSSFNIRSIILGPSGQVV